MTDTPEMPEMSADAVEAALRVAKRKTVFDAIIHAFHFGVLAERAHNQDNPKWDATDAAHPAWWRGNDHAFFTMCKQANEILDGKEPTGTCDEPWHSLRQRLWGLHLLERARAASETAIRNNILVERSRIEAELARLIAAYYRREIGRLIHQAEYWASHGYPLAVHYRIIITDAFYQIIALMERDPGKGWQPPFEVMREAVAKSEQGPGTYPPSEKLGLYRDPRYVVEQLDTAIPRAASVPIDDFLELYDAAHAVIDQIRLHVDHAEYEGGMNAVENFREIASSLRWKHDDKVPDPLTEDESEA